MAITYNAGTNTITVTGYTLGSPCTFTLLYNADVAGGWGVITKQSDEQFYLNAKLLISSGYFVDTKKQIVVNDLGITTEILVNNGAYFISGTLLNEGRKSSKEGCAFHFQRNAWSHGIYGNAGANIYLYSTHLSTDTTSYLGITGISKIYNTYFDRVYLRSSSVTMSNVLFMCGGFAMYNVTGVWDKVVIMDYSFGITIATNQDIANVTQKGCGAIRAYKVTTDSSLTDCDIDTWHFTWTACTANIYRKHSFNLKVVDENGDAIDGATVKIWDSGDNLVVDTTTTGGGLIPTQTLNYGYYNNSDTPTMQTPHKIEIKKVGTNYLTYESYFNIDKKLDLKIAMVDMSDLIEDLDDIKGTGFVKDTHSLTKIKKITDLIRALIS